MHNVEAVVAVDAVAVLRFEVVVGTLLEVLQFEVLRLPRLRPLPQALRLRSKAVWKVAFLRLPRELSLSRLPYLPRPPPLPAREGASRSP